MKQTPMVRGFLGHLGEGLDEMGRELLPIVKNQRPPFPDTVISIKGTQSRLSIPDGVKIIHGIEIPGVPNPVFKRESRATRDPHMAVEALVHVLSEQLGPDAFRVLIREFDWTQEVPHPQWGYNGIHHPFALAGYHLAFQHDDRFREEVLRQGGEHLTDCFKQGDLVIFFVHSYGAMVAMSLLERIPIPAGKEVIVVGLAPALNGIGHGRSPIGPATTEREFLAMAKKVRGIFLARSEKDWLSGFPELLRVPPSHCELVTVPKRGWEAPTGWLMPHMTVRTNPEVRERLENFLRRILENQDQKAA